MEKSGLQIDSSSPPPAYVEMGGDVAPSKVSRSALLRIPCTAVLITALLVSGAITITAVVYKGSANCQQPTSDGRLNGTRDKVLDHDAVKHLELIGRNGVTTPETMTYNSALNTVVVNVPGNFSFGSSATIAIDFDRDVVFTSIHDENTCVAFALGHKMAEITKNLMRNKEHNQVIDLVSDTAMTGNYRVAGTMPEGYVKAANGPIIRGMCSGRRSQWLEEGDAAMSGRQKRSPYFCPCICFPFALCCPWGWGWECEWESEREWRSESESEWDSEREWRSEPESDSREWRWEPESESEREWRWEPESESEREWEWISDESFYVR